MSIKAQPQPPLNTGAVSQNTTASKASMNYFRGIHGMVLLRKRSGSLKTVLRGVKSYPCKNNS